MGEAVMMMDRGHVVSCHAYAGNGLLTWQKMGDERLSVGFVGI